MPVAGTPRDWLDRSELAGVLEQTQRLEVVARRLAEGLRAGSHRSALRGQSVDFADHRAYVPGDDLRHLDWKVLGRSDRLVLKRYQAEVDLAVHLAVDGSASMGYHGSRAHASKYAYAALIAGAVAVLVEQQQDRCGLEIFAEDLIAQAVPSRSGAVERICHTLVGHTPEAGTDADAGLQRLLQQGVDRGLVILVTDALMPGDLLWRCCDRLQRRGHDLALVWLLDPDEADLEVGSVSRFEGLEDSANMVAEPRALRRAYQAEVAAFRARLETGCRQRGMVHVSVTTAEPPSAAVGRLLIALQNERA